MGRMETSVAVSLDVEDAGAKPTCTPTMSSPLINRYSRKMYQAVAKDRRVEGYIWKWGAGIVGGGVGMKMVDIIEYETIPSWIHN